MYIDTNDSWCHPTHPLCLKMFSETVIGPMLDVEQALCPHHEVKFTFMKLKSQVGFLCWYGFKRQYCSALLPQHRVLLNSSTREEWNAWKHHYCTLTWSTVNGWIKVPFEMHDIKRQKKTKSNNTHNKPSPCIMLYRLGKVNVKTVELSSRYLLDVHYVTFLFSVILFTINLDFISFQENIPAMIFCAMSRNQKV